MESVTVMDAIEIEVLRAADPEVMAGRAGLHRPVRWVHSTELSDVAPLLRPGDLLLTAGTGLGDGAADLSVFVQSLSDSGVAGLIVELGRRWSELPGELVRSCDGLGLPLIALHREVRFAAVAQELGERIVNERLGELREAHRVHEVFTDLSVSEADPQQILETVQRLAARTVVLEDHDHRVIDFRLGPAGGQEILADWVRRSRTVSLSSRTGWDRSSGWLVTRVGRRDRGWGRLIIESPDAPSQRLTTVIERGAEAFALHWLRDRHHDSRIRRVHQELVLGLSHDPTEARIVQRCELAGFPSNGHHYVALAMRVVVDGRQAHEHLVDSVMADVVRAARSARVPALVAETDRTVRVLLAIDDETRIERATHEIAQAVQRRRSVVIGAGRSVVSIGAVDQTLRESKQVLASVKAPDSRRVHRLEDVHLRGLLALFGDDDRLTLFVERELAALQRHDAQTGSDLLRVLDAYLSHPGGKTGAAAQLNLSRPAFYQRLSKIERVLGVDLDDPDTRVSLHVALMTSRLMAAEES